MLIPKKKYRDKVRQRLERVKNLLFTDDRVKKILTRLNLTKPEIHDLYNIVEQLFDKDMPALLEALDRVHENQVLSGRKVEE